MHCPLCLDTTLDITFHAGIELDICPRCRGVWLDRGELERIAQDRPRHDHDHPRHDQPDRRRHDRPDSERHGETSEKGHKKGNKKRRKKRLAERLGDVFEEIIDL